MENFELLEEIKEILSTATFPCSRDEILKCAKDAHAPRRVIKILGENIGSSKNFRSIDEFVDYFAAKLEINT